MLLYPQGETLNRALQGAKVWITGLRAEQSDNRKEMKMLEWDESRQLYKFNPLIHWTYEQMIEYIRKIIFLTIRYTIKGLSALAAHLVPGPLSREKMRVRAGGGGKCRIRNAAFMLTAKIIMSPAAVPLST